MVLEYYLHLSHYMLLQKILNGNLHQINGFKVRKNTKKSIRNIFFLCVCVCVLNMLNFKRLALIATEM